VDQTLLVGAGEGQADAFGIQAFYDSFQTLGEFLGTRRTGRFRERGQEFARGAGPLAARTG